MINWTLEKRIFAGFALALVMLTAVGVLSFQTTSKLIDDERWVAHTHTVLDEVKDMRSTVQNLIQDEKYSIRSFLNSGEDRYLEPSNKDFADLEAHISQLHNLTLDNSRQQMRISAFAAALTSRQDVISRVIAARKSQGYTPYMGDVMLSLGDTQLQELQNIVADMEAEEQTLLQQRALASEVSVRTTTIVFVLAIGSVFLILSGAFWVIRRDVSERRQVEEALRASEVKFRTFIESLGEGLLITDLDDVVTYANGRMAEMVGYTVEQLMGNPAYKLMLPPALWPDAARRNLDRVRGITEQYEVELIRTDGKSLWLDVTASPLRDAVGNVVGTMGAHTDITERKRAEAALKESETRFRRLSAASREGITIQKDDKIVEVNHAMADMFGYSTDELIGKSVFALTTPISEEIARKKIAEGNEESYEVYGLRKDGSFFPMEVRGASMPFDGRTVRVSTIRDLTERHAAEEALRQSESEYRGLFENAHDAILILTPGTEIVLDANSAACRLYGFSHDEFVGRSLLPLSANPERVQTPDREIMEIGGTIEFETVQFRKDGAELTLEVTAAIVDYKGRRAFLSINRDISERKKAEEAIRASEKKYRLLMEQASDGVVVMDRAGNYIEVNHMACEALGYSRDELLAMNASQVVAPEDLAENPLLRDRLAARNGLLIERTLVRKDGTRFPVEISAKLLDDRTMQAIIRDVTERKRAERALHELATRDALTGLYNRREMDRILSEEVGRCRRYNRPLSVIMVDIDHFKLINDKHGHHIGDEVLRWIGGLFRENVRDTDRPARYGGEEMAIILPETYEQDAYIVAERFRQMVCRRPFTTLLHDGTELQIPVTISIGVAELPTDAASEEALLVASDRALYRAKRSGRNRVVSYNLYRVTTTGQLAVG